MLRLVLVVEMFVGIIVSEGKSRLEVPSSEYIISVRRYELANSAP